MKKRTELDDASLWQRGNVFKHAFVFLIAALALEACARPLASPGPGALGGDPAHLGQRCPVLVGVHPAGYQPMGRSQKTFFFAMGLCGLCMVVMELASLAAGRGPLLEEGMLTSGGAITLTGC